MDSETKKQRRAELREKRRQEDHAKIQERLDRLTCDISIEIFDFMKTDEEGVFKKRHKIDFGFSRNVQSDLGIDMADIAGEMQVFPAVYGVYVRVRSDLAAYRAETERRLDFAKAEAHQRERKRLIADPDAPNERITDAWVNACVESDEYVVALRSLYNQINSSYWEVNGFIAALDTKKDMLLELMRTQRKDMDLNHGTVIGDRFSKAAARAAKAGKS